MLRLLPFLLLLVLTSCVTKPAAIVSPAAVYKANSVAIMPPVVAKAATTLLRSAVAPEPMARYVDFVYPSDVTNYLWHLVQSTNLTDWEVQPQVYYGAPSTNTYYKVTNNSGKMFYRMMGTKIIN